MFWCSVSCLSCWRRKSQKNQGFKGGAGMTTVDVVSGSLSAADHPTQLHLLGHSADQGCPAQLNKQQENTRKRHRAINEEGAMTATTIALGPMSKHQSALRRAVIASTVGTTIEWYDFLIYSTVTGLVFNKVYFPDRPLRLCLRGDQHLRGLTAPRPNQ